MKVSDIVKGLSNDVDVSQGLALAGQWDITKKVVLVVALFKQAVQEVRDQGHNSQEKAEELLNRIDDAAQNIKNLVIFLLVLKSELGKKHFEAGGSYDTYGKEASRASQRLMKAAETFIRNNFSDQLSEQGAQKAQPAKQQP